MLEREGIDANCKIALRYILHKREKLDPCTSTHRSSFVSALSESSSTDADVIPPTASRAEAKNSIFMEMDGM